MSWQLRKPVAMAVAAAVAFFWLAGVARAQEAERRAFKEAVKKKRGPMPSAAQPASKSGKSSSGGSDDYDFSDGTAEGQLGSGAMRRANRVAARILEHRMNQQRPDELRLVREAGAADVVVVQGRYDRVQDVLK